MKNKFRILSMLLCTAFALTVVALAYYVEVTAECKMGPKVVYGYGTTVANSSELLELHGQVAILDDDLNEYGFAYKTIPNPDQDTIKVATGVSKDEFHYYTTEYCVQAAGSITYMTKYGPVHDIQSDEDYFVVTEDGIRALSKKTDNSTELRRQYNNIRADHIFQEFGMSPEQYTYACNFELLNYIEPDAYISIRESMNIEPGTTTPSFYIDGDTIFGVCQDADATNRMYKFTQETDGTWSLCDAQQLQDIGRYQDVYQTFAEFQVTAE